MKCEKIKELIPDYICGNPDSKTRSRIDDHLAECAGCKQIYEEVNLVWIKLAQIPQEEPGPAVRSQFYCMLETYRHGLNDVPVKLLWNEKLSKWLESWWPQRPVFQLGVAVIFLIFGTVIGQRIDYGIRSQGEMAQLRDEVREMRQLVTHSLLNQSSAIERLHGLSMSRFVNDPDEEFLSVLMLTLNSDTNVNVRLAAVNALLMYSDNLWLRTELVKSLSHQTSPLVQIALIDLLVGIREQTAFEALRALSNDTHSIEAVKNRARWGINQII